MRGAVRCLRSGSGDRSRGLVLSLREAQVLAVEGPQSCFDIWADADDAVFDALAQERNPKLVAAQQTRPAHGGWTVRARRAIGVHLAHRDRHCVKALVAIGDKPAFAHFLANAHVAWVGCAPLEAWLAFRSETERFRRVPATHEILTDKRTCRRSYCATVGNLPCLALRWHC